MVYNKLFLLYLLNIKFVTKKSIRNNRQADKAINNEKTFIRIFILYFSAAFFVFVIKKII